MRSTCSAIPLAACIQSTSTTNIHVYWKCVVATMVDWVRWVCRCTTLLKTFRDGLLFKRIRVDTRHDLSLTKPDGAREIIVCIQYVLAVSFQNAFERNLAQKEAQFDQPGEALGSELGNQSLQIWSRRLQNSR